MQPLETQLPRIFQANILRLYDRVVRPGINFLPVHSELVFGEAPTLDAFLDRAAAQVDNYTANEAAKAFALALCAVFERQLSVWSAAIVAGGGAASPGKAPRFETLLTLCADFAAMDLDALGLRADLRELLLVGNVVRHGDGASCDLLREAAPALWAYEPSAYVDIVAGPPRISELMRIQAEDLARYARASARFWGHADPLPMAVQDTAL